jgi:hypothetical protein
MAAFSSPVFYFMNKKIPKGEPWTTAPISPTCEVLVSEVPLKFCDEPTVMAYPAMRKGWMALCEKCGLKHANYSSRTDDLISRGETWK